MNRVAERREHMHTRTRTRPCVGSHTLRTQKNEPRAAARGGRAYGFSVRALARRAEKFCLRPREDESAQSGLKSKMWGVRGRGCGVWVFGGCFALVRCGAKIFSFVKTGYLAGYSLRCLSASFVRGALFVQHHFTASRHTHLAPSPPPSSNHLQRRHT